MQLDDIARSFDLDALYPITSGPLGYGLILAAIAALALREALRAWDPDAAHPRVDDLATVLLASSLVPIVLRYAALAT